MKFLIFADLHGDLDMLKNLIKKAEEADAIICAGDITIFEQDMNKIINALAGTKKLIFIIPGNHESASRMENMCKHHKNIVFLHKKIKILGKHILIGYGSGGFSLVDNNLKKSIGKIKDTVNKHNGKKIILISHGPPFKTNLDLIACEHCGSKTIKELILHIQPDLFVCGHFHENFGVEDNIGNTRAINPGPKGKIINL